MNLYLISVTPEKKVSGIQALRKVARLLVEDGRQSPEFDGLAEASDTWDALRDGRGPLFAFETNSPTLLADCIQLLEAGGIGHAPDYQSKATEESEPDQEYEGPTLEACEAALVMMAATDGNSASALTIARTLQRITSDQLWEDVSMHLLSTFPPMNQQEAQTLLYEGPEGLDEG